MTRRGLILFLSLGLLWGMPYLLIRIAVAEIDPVVVAGTRTLIGALLLLPVALHRNALVPAFRKWKWLLGGGRRRGGCGGGGCLPIFLPMGGFGGGGRSSGWGGGGFGGGGGGGFGGFGGGGGFSGGGGGSSW
jgi:hypothetical protein